MPIEISFSSKDKILNASDGALYIAGRINNKPTNGILIDPICGENVIME